MSFFNESESNLSKLDIVGVTLLNSTLIVAISSFRCAHWTGHEKRLNRPLDNKIGDIAYAKEELTAELGAAFPAAEFGIVQPEKADHAAYISNWLEVLKNNKEFVVSASRNASKAVQFLKELQPLKFEK